MDRFLTLCTSSTNTVSLIDTLSLVSKSSLSLASSIAFLVLVYCSCVLCSSRPTFSISVNIAAPIQMVIITPVYLKANENSARRNLPIFPSNNLFKRLSRRLLDELTRKSTDLCQGLLPYVSLVISCMVIPVVGFVNSCSLSLSRAPHP